MKNIVLTGFMGTGKTTVGVLLAKKLGRRFIDTDNLIEEQENRRIIDTFAQDGEQARRQIVSLRRAAALFWMRRIEKRSGKTA